MTTKRSPKSRKPRRAPALRVVTADTSVVRLSRVRSAQKRIESGYYDRDDVRDRLVHAVLGEILKG